MWKKRSRKPKSERKKLIDKLDVIFSLYIRARDKNKCFTCGTTFNPTCGHLITSAKYSVRWDERNAYCQCGSCNLSHEYNPQVYTSKWLSTNSLREYQALVRDSARSHKFTNKELEDLVEYFRKKLHLIS